MTGDIVGIEPGSSCVTLQHDRHCLAAESRWPDATMAVNGAKCRSLGDT
jgi:hypothetical protein